MGPALIRCGAAHPHFDLVAAVARLGDDFAFGVQAHQARCRGRIEPGIFQRFGIQL